MRMGIPRDVYDRGTAVAHDLIADQPVVIESRHIQATTRKEAEEAKKSLGDFVKDQIKPNLKWLSDPDSGPLAEAAAHIEAAGRWQDQRVPDPGFETDRDVVEGVEEHGYRTEVITRRVAMGDFRDERTGRGWRLAVVSATLVDAISVWAMLCYLMGVDFFNPLADAGRWGFALIGALFVALLTYFFAMNAGKIHNQMAELDEGDRPQDHARKRREGMVLLTFAAVCGLVNTGIALVRTLGPGTAGRPMEELVLALISVVVGAALPIVTYLDYAKDGTRLSRSLEPLARALDEGAEVHVYHRTEAQRKITYVNNALKDAFGEVGTVLTRTQEMVDASLEVLNFAALQAGINGFDKPKAPPLLWREPDTTDGQMRMAEGISCGIDHAARVDTQALVDVLQRIGAIKAAADRVQADLDAAPYHPWTRRVAGLGAG
jgi:hypothetical protein